MRAESLEGNNLSELLNMSEYTLETSQEKKRCFLAYHVQESYGKHDILGNKIHMNWHNSWMFPTAFPNNKKETCPKLCQFLCFKCFFECFECFFECFECFFECFECFFECFECFECFFECFECFFECFECFFECFECFFECFLYITLFTV